ncbi:MAG: DUF433 domain-containing protein [Bacteroidota bacterium]|nr:DUF433 domain-containing protein [Bacteroidota bacterium]
MNWQENISTDPKIMFGKPCIKGTRITVDLIVEKIGYGQTIEQILNSYPHLTRQQVNSCLLYAAETIRKTFVYAE